MGKSDLPRINEVASFLDRFEPGLMKDLAASNPELSEVLETGLEGGPAPSIDEETVRKGLAIRGEILAAALAAAILRAHAEIERINQLVARARRFRFWAGVFAAVSAAGAVWAAILGAKPATIVTGSLALASNLLALFATKVLLGSDAREAELIALARRMSKASAGAELVQALLGRMPEAGFEIAEMRSLIQESNMLFAEMNDALANAGS